MKSDWNYTIGNVCSVGDGAHSKVERLTEGILYLTSKNIGKGRLIKLEEAEYISEDAYAKLFPIKSKSTRHPFAGDILIGIIGSFGNSYIYTNEDKFGFSSSIGILRPHKEIVDSKYLYYIINSNKFQAYNKLYNTGSVQGYTNMSTVKSLPIPLQDLPIQKKIARILSTLDDKIELNRKMNQTLEGMAQALFKSWFVDFDPVHAKAIAKSDEELEHAAKELGISKEVLELFPSAFVESEMGMIPEGWIAQSLEELVFLKYGKMPNKIDLVEAGYPIYTGYRIAGYHKQYLYENRELIVVARGVGGTGDIKISPPMSWITNISIVLHTKNESMKYFLYYFLLGQNLRTLDSGSAQSQITINDLKKLQILLPEKKQLNYFYTIIKSLIEQVQQNEYQIETLQKTRDTLLPKLLSGELDVSTIKLEEEK